MKKVKKSTIKNKITLSFLICIFLPFLILFVMFFRMSTSYANKMSIQYLKQNLFVIQEQTEEIFDTFRNLSMMLYHNKSVDILSSHQMNDKEKTEVEDVLSSILNTSKGLSSIYIKKEDQLYSSGKSYQYMEQYFKENETQVKHAGGRMIWLPVEAFEPYSGKTERKFVAARTLYSKSNLEVGTLWMLLDASLLDNIFANNHFLSGSKNYVLSRDGKISLSSEENQLEKHFDMALLNLNSGERQASFFNKVNGKKSLIVYTLSYTTDWVCLSITPQSEILQDFGNIKNYFVLFLFIYIIFIIIMFQILDKNVFEPVKRLIHGVDQVAQGDFNVQIISQCEDEMGKLTMNFNTMVSKIASLLIQVKKEEKEKNDFKMQALMMQMSPHFIYNTLNTIKWIAVINKQDNIRILIESLVQIFMSMSKKNDENNTIKDELKLLESYINIQKARYTNFDVEFQLEEGIERLRIKQFLLQPVIENSILHGMSDQNKNGKIIIRMYTNQQLHIEVEDNGKGFEVDRLSDLSFKKNSAHTHIGIDNVNQIIQLEYGNEYGIHINSKPNEGTRVTYILPILFKIIKS